MDTQFMTFFAEGLAKHGARVARFEFPYMSERRISGKKTLPNKIELLIKTWHQVIDEIGHEKLIIGGKSLGGRVASMIADEGLHEPIIERNKRTKAEIRAKEAGTLAGLYVADILIREWMPGARFTWTSGEGSRIDEDTCILTIEGCRHQILSCERIILNILGRLSGIASNTFRWVSNSQIPLAATRKTAWGTLDKAAVGVGGGLTHRIHRADALMLKENDLASTAEDGDEGAVRVRKVLSDIQTESIGAFVTVEVRSLDEALAAAEAWAERMLENEEGVRLNILLDNMGPELSRDAVLDIETRGLRQYVTLEASGNITFDDLESWRTSLVDVISTSALHRAAPPLDLTCIFEGV